MSTKRNWTKYLDAFFLVGGLAILVFMLQRQPLGDISQAALAMGPLAFLTPLIALAWFPTHTMALWVLLDEKVPWVGLLFNRLVGDGYNALLPMAGMGGEPFKLRHLTRFINHETAIVGLVRDRVIDNAVGFAFSALWLFITLGHFALPSALRDGLFGYAIVAAVLSILSMWIVRTRLPGKLGKVLGKWLSGASDEPPPLSAGLALRAAAWSLVSRFLGMAEIAVMLHAVDLPIDLWHVGFVDSALNAAGFVGFLFPQGIGVFEGSTVYLLGLFGTTPAAALAFALVRRGRMLTVSLIGVAIHLLSKARGSEVAIAVTPDPE